MGAPQGFVFPGTPFMVIDRRVMKGNVTFPRDYVGVLRGLNTLTSKRHRQTRMESEEGGLNNMQRFPKVLGSSGRHTHRASGT